MTPMNGWMKRPTRTSTWVVLVIALVALLSTASVAIARYDEGGGPLVARPYAPYTAGPVVPSTPLEPYAPYTAGPVVPNTPLDTRPYAPYTAGPVVREDRPYAPYTAGPVVREKLPDRVGNFPIY